MLVEITTYTDEKAGKQYCEECKPKGKLERGILIVCNYDSICAGCGESFKEIAEQDEEAEQPSEDAICDMLEMMQENLYG